MLCMLILIVICIRYRFLNEICIISLLKFSFHIDFILYLLVFLCYIFRFKDDEDVIFEAGEECNRVVKIAFYFQPYY